MCATVHFASSKFFGCKERPLSGFTAAAAANAVCMCVWNDERERRGPHSAWTKRLQRLFRVRVSGEFYTLSFVKVQPPTPEISCRVVCSLACSSRHSDLTSIPKKTSMCNFLLCDTKLFLLQRCMQKNDGELHLGFKSS